MNTRNISEESIEKFREYLTVEEKSTATIEKYLRDIRALADYMKEKEMKKELLLDYKNYLLNKGYAIRSINSMLASVNSYLSFRGWEMCRVKNMRIQKQIYCAENKELTKNEYFKLVYAAKRNSQLYLILQTICGTGIRVSELKYFTVEAVRTGEIIVNCKNKTRVIIVPGKLKKNLLGFATKRGIKKGQIFLSANGKTLHRSSIWAKMKKLSEKAGVNPKKIFPHNLRKLFARTFYHMEKDIAKLADILGHNNIETTRIYIMTSSGEHRLKIEKMKLII